MTKIDDKDFFDTLYTQFTKTTDAADRYWMPEEVEGHGYTIWAVGEHGRTEIGAFLFEEDADFVTAIHGCTPDLVRRLHAALDEADRADRERDEREQQIGRLSLENQELREEIANVEAKLIDERGYSAFIECDKSDLTAELAEANEACARLEETLATARSKAADVLWKSERWT